MFEELPSTDNASGFRSGVSSGLSSAATSPLESVTAEGAAAGVRRTESQHSASSGRGVARVLVASRHLRHDSKTIQLEQPAPHSRSGSRDLSLDQIKQFALKSVENLDLSVLPLAPKCGDDESKRLIEGAGVLRHRRTGSRELRAAPPRHKRTASHHLTLEPHAHDLSLPMQKGRSVDHLASAPHPRL